MPIVAITALSIWIESWRFGFRTPSLIDDWFGVTYSAPAFHALIHGAFGSSGLDFPGRYRPAYTGIWDFAQWHVLGRPSLAAAAAWGVIRSIFFVTAVWLLTAFLVPRRRRQPLIWLPSLAVALTPAIAVILVRYGPGEPMMVGGVIVGLCLFGRGAVMLLGRPCRHRTRALALLAVGYAVYLLGVYSKENSIALLAFVPFFLKWASPALREYVARARMNRYVIGAGAALLIAPLLHLGFHVAAAAVTRQSPWPNAHLSLGLKVYSALVSPFFPMPGIFHTWTWFFAPPAAIGTAVALARRRHRDAWLVAGVLVTGFLMAAFSLARGPEVANYYLPWLIAIAVVAFRGLCHLPVRITATLGLLVVLMAFGTRQALTNWQRTERSSEVAISWAKGVADAGCPLYLANFDIEQRVALPLFFRFTDGTLRNRCASASSEAYVVSWKGKPLPNTFRDQCHVNWSTVATSPGVGLYRCRSFEAGWIPDQYAASGHPEVTVVRVAVPSHRPLPRQIFQSQPLQTHT